jgi:hypothetical protein
MPDPKTISRGLAIGFIFWGLVAGVFSYIYFSPQFEWLAYGVLHLNINGYILPAFVNLSIMAWIYLFTSILFLVIGFMLLVLYIILPGNLTPDYEQYLYPSSPDKKTNSL